MKRLGLFPCLLVAMASLCHAQGPQAEIRLNDSLLFRGGSLSATFHLKDSITQPFTVFAVVIMPNGSMLDARTLGPKLKPVATNVPRLDPPLSYPLLSLKIPTDAPLGWYEVVAVFFDPSKPITGRADAFLNVSAKFEVFDEWYMTYGPYRSNDVVMIGTVYVATEGSGLGCAWGALGNLHEAMDWPEALVWLEKDDWRLPTQEELIAICAAKDTIYGFTYTPYVYWSSTRVGTEGASRVNFKDCSEGANHEDNRYHVRSVRSVEQQ